MESKASRALALVAVSTVALSLIALLPDGFNRWTFPKYALVAIAVVCATFARRTGTLPRWAWWCFAAIGAALVIAAIAGLLLNGTSVWASLLGRWPRYLGPLTALPVALGAAWIGAALLGSPPTRRPRRALEVAISVVAVAIATIAVLESFGLRPIESDLDRPGSLLGNATDQGIVCAMLLIVLLALLLGSPLGDRLHTATQLVGLMAAGVGLVLSASRGAYVGAAAGIAILLVLGWMLHVVARRRLIVAGASILLSLLAAVLLTPGVASRVTGSDPLAAATASERLLLWERGWQVFSQAPLTGGGSGSFIDRVMAFHDVAWFTERSRNTVLESAHNWVLDAAADGGILLLLVLLLFAFLVARDGLRRARFSVEAQDTQTATLTIGALSALGAAGTALLAHPTGPAVVILCGLFAGVAIGRAVTPRAAFETRGRTVIVRSVVGVWAVALILAATAEVPLRSAYTDAISADDRAAQLDLARGLRAADPEMALIGAQIFAEAVSKGDFAALEQAERWSSAAVELFPSSLTALGARAAILEANSDWSALVPLRERMLALAPNNVVIQLDLAIDLANTGQFERTVQEANLVLQAAPDLTNAALLIDEVCAISPVDGCP